MAHIPALLLVALLTLGSRTFAQTYDWHWARSARGTGSENGTCLATDKDGNVFVAGYFYSAVLYIGNDTLINSGNYDVFLAKYDADGKPLWARRAGGGFDDVCQGVTTDSGGNVYIAGYYYSPQFCTPSSTLINAGSGDVFLIKYDGQGNELWSRSFGSNKEESGNALCADVSGNILMTGHFSSSVFSPGTFSLQKSGGQDVFVLKLDQNGTVTWADSFSGMLNEQGTAIAADAAGNIFITGTFYSQYLANSADTVWNTGSNDAFIAKYSNQGNLVWLRSAGGDYNDSGYGICVDASGDICMVGSSNSPSLSAGNFNTTNAGNFDLFIIRYTSSGLPKWLRGNGGIFDDTGLSITCDQQGDLFVTGHSHSPSIIFGNDTLVTHGAGDVYVAAYSAAGENLWVRQAGGQADDGSSGLAIDASGNIFVSGYFLSQEISSPQFTLNNCGAEDLFLGKLKREINTTGLSRATRETEFIVYPNPCQGVCMIRTGEWVDVKVRDGSGRQLECSVIQSNTQVQIDLAHCAPGLYFISITNQQSQTLVRKLVRN